MYLNMILHESVRIQCPAERLWRFLLEPNRWKQGIRLEPMRGKVGARAEVQGAYPSGATDPAYFIEHVEIVPLERLTIKLFQNPGEALIGFASWSLREESDAILLAYDVYAQSPVPSGANLPANAMEREQLERAVAADARQRFLTEFQTLKRLAESGTG